MNILDGRQLPVKLSGGCYIRPCRQFQCNACRKQTSVKAGTIFASSKLPLRIWFKAIYHLTQSRKGISSIELGRRLGITQTAAWIELAPVIWTDFRER